MRRILLALALLVGCLGQAAAQDWPGKPIRFVVPFATGGGTVDEARAFVKQEAVKWREVVIKSGARAD